MASRLSGSQKVSESDELVDEAFRERLREQAESAGLTLDLTQIEHFERYFRLLRHWNRSINLTALPLAGLPDRTLKRLFIEPLHAAPFVEVAPLLWFDFGSGGGSPAIPLKIVRPILRLRMVESRSRKAAFLREVARTLSLTATEVLTIRIEELARSMPGVHGDLITVRAVRIQESLLEAAAALLRPGGRLLLFGSESSPAVAHDEFRVSQRLSLAGDSTLQVLNRAG
jgi:16S rRNA (guanine527-N7)-methyltransferase